MYTPDGRPQFVVSQRVTQSILSHLGPVTKDHRLQTCNLGDAHKEVLLAKDYIMDERDECNKVWM